MPSLSIHAPVNLVILTSATLDRVTGLALPSGQLDLVGDAMPDIVSRTAASLQCGQPTLLLIDLSASLPTLAQQLETGASRPSLLVLVENDELDRVLPLEWTGASGWISQSNLVTNLASIAIAVQHGEMILPPALGQGASGQDALIEPLSKREIEVLWLLAQGLTNRDIAQSLCLSVLTVKTHLHHIFGKLDVRSRTEAALWATQHNYRRTG